MCVHGFYLLLQPFLHRGQQTQLYFNVSYPSSRRNKNCQTFTMKHKINKSNAKVSTYHCIICLYSVNICCDAFIDYKFPSECAQLQSYQALLHYYYPHTTPSNEFLLICIYQDFLPMLHPLS